VGEHDAPEETRGSRGARQGEPGEHGERRDSGLLLARRSPGARLGGGRMIDSRPADHQGLLRPDHRRGRGQGLQDPRSRARTFSIAVNYKEEGSDEKHTRWIQCADWKGLSKTVRKGDRLRVTGSFRERRYQDKKEEWKTVRTFTLVDLEIEHLSRRDEVA
jgi:hypothetical protein